MFSKRLYHLKYDFLDISDHGLGTFLGYQTDIDEFDLLSTMHLGCPRQSFLAIISTGLLRPFWYFVGRYIWHLYIIYQKN